MSVRTSVVMIIICSCLLVAMLIGDIVVNSQNNKADELLEKAMWLKQEKRNGLNPNSVVEFQWIIPQTIDEFPRVRVQTRSGKHYESSGDGKWVEVTGKEGL